MSKVQNVEKIIEQFGPHLHDAPIDGWLSDRTIDKIVPTHCPYCALQCGQWVGPTGDVDAREQVKVDALEHDASGRPTRTVVTFSGR